MAGTPSNEPNEAPSSGADSAISNEKNRILVSDLMGDEREVFLLFNGSEYRLRVTNNNKLILTK
ncbi:hemin uptake protein HemP [Nisaea nitritireducens]|uniref:hemin uptake protein HemP n=1 Tax=Nisaea nitritireducens TaxID=568392 RepID=UPI001D02DA4A|nr:hemin uptake protein HemP [Nisaea nitritireducens]